MAQPKEDEEVGSLLTIKNILRYIYLCRRQGTLCANPINKIQRPPVNQKCL